MNKDYNWLFDEQDDIEFENEWKKLNNEEKEEEIDTTYEPPKYFFLNNIAKYSQMIQIVAVYYHAKYGENINDVFEPLLDMQKFITTPLFKLN